MDRPAPPLLVARIAERQLEARARADVLRARVPELARRLRAVGASRVRLFGSLATGARPHADTDVDLCVEGLSDREAAAAAIDLESIAGARVDVVRWESASERLRARIAADGIDVTENLARGA